MGQPRVPHKVKLIMSLFFGDTICFDKTKLILIRKYGKVDFESQLLEFSHTDYYENEMGAKLKRKLISFEPLVKLRDAFMTKTETNTLEKKFSDFGKRRINIDPGYMDMSKLVLFSTKDYTHRIYIDKGIFAEGTLFYKNRSFMPWPWTYPDYKDESYIDIFNAIREIYMRQAQGERAS